MEVDKYEGGDSTGCLTNKVINNTEIELEENFGLQSSERPDSLIVVADANIVQRPFESDSTSLNTLSKHEAEYKASPSMENITANTHKINKDTEDSDKAAVECVEDALHPTTNKDQNIYFLV